MPAVVAGAGGSGATRSGVAGPVVVTSRVALRLTGERELPGYGPDRGAVYAATSLDLVSAANAGSGYQGRKSTLSNSG